ncbi:MAG: PASTA domain-containing protein [Actinomycetota bacterium]
MSDENPGGTEERSLPRTIGGRYEVGALIGRGTIADVYRGTDAVLGRTVAIKILSSQLAEDATFVAQFEREGQAAARISHPNLVAVFDAGSDEGVAYIVTEYVEGETLEAVLAREEKLPPDKATEVTESAARGLAAAHVEGVVHGDIRPSNIMLSKQGGAKLMDIGIARIGSVQTAEILGTADYLSPEQAQGRPADQRSDVYSLGVVFYKMLTGRTPFSGDSAVGVAYQHANEAPTPPREIDSTIPGEMELIVLRMLAKDPAARYANDGDLVTDLERARRGEGPTPLPVAAPTEEIGKTGLEPTAMFFGPTGKQPRSKKIPLIAAAVAAVILAIVAFFLLQAGDKVRVPALVGTNVEQAKQQLGALQLGANVVEQPGQGQAPGTVLSQEPSPGTEVDTGTTITLNVVSQSTTVLVPNLVDQPEAQAVNEIEAAGLVLGTVERRPATGVAEGVVMEQNPLGGAEVAAGTPVNLVISAGAEVVTVPPVTCRLVPEGQTILQEAGLTMNIIGVEANDLCPEPNKIARQEPVSGEQVGGGTVINVWTTTPVTSTPTPSGTPSPTPTAAVPVV